MRDVEGRAARGVVRWCATCTIDHIMLRSAKVAGLSLVSIVLAACGGAEHRPASTTQTTSAALRTAPVATSSSMGDAKRTNATTTNDATTTSSSAVVRLSSARCDRAAACSTGATDRDGCMNEVGADLARRLPEDRCIVVSAEALAACAAEMSAEPCGAAKPLDALGSCARDRLCPAPIAESPR